LLDIANQAHRLINKLAAIECRKLNQNQPTFRNPKHLQYTPSPLVFIDNMPAISTEAASTLLTAKEHYALCSKFESLEY
jgi:hypothetical protein